MPSPGVLSPMHEMVVSSRSLGCPVSRKLFSIPRMMWSASIDVAKPEAATFAPSFINPAASCCSMIFMVMSLSFGFRFCSLGSLTARRAFCGCTFCDRATKDGPQALPQVRFHCMQNIGLLLRLPESSPAELTVRAGLPARRIRPFRLPGRFFCAAVQWHFGKDTSLTAAGPRGVLTRLPSWRIRDTNRVCLFSWFGVYISA